MQIVCGAPNVRAGLKAPLATVGAKLPGGMEIKQAKLRGVESFGMLCSARELGLAEDASGLLELPADAARSGAALVDALGLDDTILEVNLTPNRGDCMSVLGVAREVAALTGRAADRAGTGAPVPAASTETFPVELTPGAGCARFASRVIRACDPQAKSPALDAGAPASRRAAPDQRRGRRHQLRDARTRPADACLRPARARRRHRRAPRARRARRSSCSTAARSPWTSPVLVIADRDKALGLAGVMGGDHSGIGDDTTDVLLEVAYFQPDAIAGRGRRYGLVTDASQRFERGVDPTLQERAIERATALLCACAGGAPGPTQLAELRRRTAARRRACALRPERARRVIGADIDDAAIAVDPARPRHAGRAGRGRAGRSRRRRGASTSRSRKT